MDIVIVQKSLQGLALVLFATLTLLIQPGMLLLQGINSLVLLRADSRLRWEGARWPLQKAIACAVSPFAALFAYALPFLAGCPERVQVLLRPLEFHLACFICALLALIPFWAWLCLSGSSEAGLPAVSTSSSAPTRPTPASSETRLRWWVAMSSGAILILSLVFGAAFLSMTALWDPRPFPSVPDSARMKWALTVALCPLALAATIALGHRLPRTTGALLAACTAVAACLGWIEALQESWWWSCLVFVWAPMTVLGVFSWSCAPHSTVPAPEPRAPRLVSSPPGTFVLLE